MATNITQEQAFRAGPLTRDDFKSWQEAFEAFASNLIGSFNAGTPGAPGTPGATPKIEVKTLNVASGASFVDFGENVEESIVNLINNVDSAPTIRITAINGGIVHLSAVTPNANFKMKMMKWTVE